MDNLIVFGIVIVAAAAMFCLQRMQSKKVKFNKLILIGLFGGIVAGIVIQLAFGAKSYVTTTAVDWISIVGTGYVSLLKMLVIPLISISLISAFTRLEVTAKLRKIAGNVLGILFSTTAVAALFGVLSVFLFKLQTGTFLKGLTADKAALANLQAHQAEVADQTLPQQLVSFLPNNIFADFAGIRPTSTIAVVIFSIMVGLVFLRMKKKKVDLAERFTNVIELLSELVTRILKMVLRLTPYGVFALMIKATATASAQDLVKLGVFIIAVYFALILVLLMHTIILLAHKINPVVYYKKAWPALAFAFTSRSSAGTLPLNIEVQTKSLGVASSVANFAGSFGLTMGQNGCAGVYPAMVATLIAATNGVNVFSAQFIITLLLIVTVSSFGVAGVGGGAIFSSLIVLGALNLPITLMGVIIAIDPIIDMMRTLVNVNDSILAGIITAKKTDMWDKEVFEDTTDTTNVVEN